jgi:hypothetical protein
LEFTPDSIRETVRDLGFKIESEADQNGFHRWDLAHRDLAIGAVVEVESTWIFPGRRPPAVSDLLLNDLRVILHTLVDRRPPPVNKQWICFYQPVGRKPGEVLPPCWHDPIDYRLPIT